MVDTTPVVVFIVAIVPRLTVLQTPPVESLDKVIEEPKQTELFPVIAATTGSALIVIDLDTEVLQPAALVNV